jgi:hypothetical protein
MAKKSKSGSADLKRWLEELQTVVEAFPQYSSAAPTNRQIQTIRNYISATADRLTELANELDPVRLPSTMFDPSHPEVVARVVALALLAQPRVLLDAVDRFYGSGIYALYYTGEFEHYEPISGKEHPIYVGKADPKPSNAPTAMDQGEKVAKRLSEHRKSISKAKNIDVEDFECRYLVVASGWQEAAERHLIGLYKPIWNKETKIVYGIGKHGDAASTRANKRSPWDTLHPGRVWAGHSTEDQYAHEDIAYRLAAHFRGNPLYSTREEAMDRFLEDMCQS